MIRVDESEAYFNKLVTPFLQNGGTDVERVWEVFKKFSAVEVDCAESALLFECGVYDFDGIDQFHFNFVRQYVIEVDGEYDSMEQLHCDFRFEPNEELSELETAFWSYDTKNDFHQFFEMVERLPQFKTPIGKYKPVKVEVFQEQV